MPVKLLSCSHGSDGDAVLLLSTVDTTLSSGGIVNCPRSYALQMSLGQVETIIEGLRRIGDQLDNS